MITLRANLKGHKDNINGVIIDTTFKQLISWSDDTTIRVWSLDNAHTLIISNHNTQITNTLLLRTGWIVSTGYDGIINIWNTKTNISYKTLSKPATSFMGTVQWDEEHIVSWDLEGNLCIWNIVDGKECATLEDAVFSYQEVSPTPPFLLWTAQNKIITWGTMALDFWDFHTGKCIDSYLEHTNSIEGALLLKENKLLTWSSDATLKVWTADGNIETNLVGHQGPIQHTILLEDETIVSWDNHYIIHIWNHSTKMLQQRFTHHQSTITEVWEVSEQFLLSKSIDGHHFIWDRQSGIIKSTFQTFSCGGVLVNPNLFVSWKEDTMTYWDLNTGTLIHSDKAHPKPITQIIAIDNSSILSWAEDNIIRIWDVN